MKTSARAFLAIRRGGGGVAGPRAHVVHEVEEAKVAVVRRVTTEVRSAAEAIGEGAESRRRGGEESGNLWLRFLL